MNEIYLFVSIILILFSIPTRTEILRLTDKNFNKALKSHPFLIVKFYSEGCKYCREMAPEYRKASQMAIKMDFPYKFGEMDTEEAVRTKKKYKVNQVPTIKLFIRGKHIDFNGARTAQNILNFLKENTEVTNRLESEEQIKGVVNRNEAVVFFFAEKGSKVQQIGDQVQVEENTRIYAVENPDLLSFFNESGKLPMVILIKKFDNPKMILKKKSELTKDNIQKFIVDNTFQAVLPLTKNTISIVFGENIQDPDLIPTKPGIFLLLQEKSPKLEGDFYKLAMEKKGSGEIFIKGGGKSEGLGGRLSRWIGLKEENLPLIYIINKETKGIRKFLMTHQYTMNYEGISSFYDHWKRGKLVKVIKSEDITPQIEDNVVQKLVGDNYVKEIRESGKDVLVKFHAPWCGICEKVIFLYIFI